MKRATVWVVVLSLWVTPTAAQAGEDLVLGLSSASEGAILGNTADYDWWYGCSPTSAGMAMGYYDRNGYGGLSYSNLVAGGVAESSTFPSTAGTWSYLVLHYSSIDG